MKKQFTAPEMEVVKFSQLEEILKPSDIITTPVDPGDDLWS